MLQSFSRSSDHPLDTDALLDQFEAEWHSETTPSLAGYLNETTISKGDFCYELFALDLEYRWKQFEHIDDSKRVDEHGFPLLPTLEDYATLVGAQWKELCTPQLIAEEYRVRWRWGDRPERRQYKRRFPDQSETLDTAFDQVETELEYDCESREIFQTETTRDYGPVDHQWANRPSEPLQVGDTLGRYELTEPVGRGGFGEVWKAYDPDLGRVVAIKIPRPDKDFHVDVIQGFIHEGKRWANLGPIPGIVCVFDAGTDSGIPYIVSEFIEGETLSQRLKRGDLSIDEIVRIMTKVSKALHQAHRRGLVHRDLKSANILLDKDGNPYVTDFGLAGTEEELLRDPRKVVGTLAYMPPESLTGKSHLASVPSDIYSLGVVLYEMLTKELPFTESPFEQYREQILYKTPRPPGMHNDSIPQRLEDICLRCLAKDPEQRYRSARVLESDLRKSLKHSSGRFRMAFIVAMVALVLMPGAIILASLYFKERETMQPVQGTAQDNQGQREYLLDRIPEKVIWDAGFIKNNYGLDKEKTKFTVRTKGDAFFLLGNNTSNHFSYRVRFTIEDPKCRFGIVWGLGKKQRERAEGVTQAHMVRVKMDNKDRGTLEFREWTFRDWPRVFDTKLIYLSRSIQHQFQPTMEVEMEVEVREGQLVRLRIQDTEFPGIPTEKRVFHNGRLGVFLSGGYFVITEAWYQNLEN